MFALESAMDELAIEVGIDPVELRIRNEPEADPELGIAFSSRNLVGCLRRGAELFGWTERDPRPGVRRQWPMVDRHRRGVERRTRATRSPATASATARADGSFAVSINAHRHRHRRPHRHADPAPRRPSRSIGSRVEIRIGDSDLPRAGVAGGSAGHHVLGMGGAQGLPGAGRAAGRARRRCRSRPRSVTVTASTSADLKAREELSRHAFGAQFAEAWVDMVTRARCGYRGCSGCSPPAGSSTREPRVRS